LATILTRKSLCLLWRVSRIFRDVEILGEVVSPYNTFGKSVSGAGDVNGDGYDDVIISNDAYNNNLEVVFIFITEEIQ
jgi:hypothetical protein